MTKEIKVLESQLLSLVAELSEIREKQLKEREMIYSHVNSLTYEIIEKAQIAIVNEKAEKINDIAKKINSSINEELGFI